MQYRRLGNSGLKISEVALGGWLTHGRTLDDQTTTDIVHHAFESGINFFDTADIYNIGKAESALSKAIKPFRRDDLVIGTKCFFPMSDRPNDRGLSRKHIFESVHHSLKRLEVDYIDLMQCHRYDVDTPVEETVEAMNDLIRQGKILYWGVSEWKADQIESAVQIARRNHCHVPISNQPSYSLLYRVIEEEVIPTSEKLGLGQVVFSPLAQGILTGKYLPGQPRPAGSRGADDKSNMFMQDNLTDENLTKVQQLNEFAQNQGVTLAQFSLAWCLRKANVSCVIVGATRVEQLQENLKASGLNFDESIWAQAEAILKA